MSELKPFNIFDKKTTRLIKETAKEFNIDEDLAALLIADFERNCEKFVKFRWNFRIPALGLFYLSTAKVKKQKYKHGKEELPKTKNQLSLNTQYNAYLDKKREVYRINHSGGEQSSGGTEDSGNSSSGAQS